MYRVFTNISIAFLLSIIIFFDSEAQNFSTSGIPSPEWVEQHKDSLRKALLINKELHSDFEHSILAALMRYPDLEHTNIDFKKRNITTTMAALPSAGSIFRKRENRRYSILINDRKNRRKAPLLKNAPFEARVGVIGHELAHIVDYRNKSFVRIVANGIAYMVSKTFRRNLEYKVDKITLNRGLGEGLYAFRLFVEEDAKTTEKYRRFKDKVYMSSSEIAKMIDAMDDIAINDNFEK